MRERNSKSRPHGLIDKKGAIIFWCRIQQKRKPLKTENKSAAN